VRRERRGDRREGERERETETQRDRDRERGRRFIWAQEFETSLGNTQISCFKKKKKVMVATVPPTAGESLPLLS
jgi:hypothetical protein